MDNTKIKDFIVGREVQGFYMIRESVARTTTANKQYMDFLLTDKTGEINGKWWDYIKEKGDTLTPGNVIKVRGNIIEWQGKPQFRMNRLRLINEGDRVDPRDFVLSAPMDSDDMFEELQSYIQSIKDMDIRNIVVVAVNERKRKLMHYPAAMRNHHSIHGGLLYHILTMLRLAERIAEVYSHLNKDLLYGGVILHDLEKINEMDSNELGVVSEYTMEGLLLGHIVQGIKTIERIGKEVDADEETVILLQHMLLSHHYEPEYGSPKRPMIPEGEILHYLDIIDARMYDMQKELEHLEKGDFSDKVWLLHNRQLYKHGRDNDE